MRDALLAVTQPGSGSGVPGYLPPLTLPPLPPLPQPAAPPSQAPAATPAAGTPSRPPSTRKRKKRGEEDDTDYSPSPMGVGKGRGAQTRSRGGKGRKDNIVVEHTVPMTAREAEATNARLPDGFMYMPVGRDKAGE